MGENKTFSNETRPKADHLYKDVLEQIGKVVLVPVIDFKSPLASFSMPGHDGFQSTVNNREK